MKTKENVSLLINPFARIAGVKALIIGLIVFVVSILLAYSGNMIFDGLVHVGFSDKVTLGMAFALPAISLAIFIVLLYIAGLLLSKSSIRFIDVAGTITLSRTPLLLISLVALVPGMADSSKAIIQGLFIQNFSQVEVVQWGLFLLFVFVSIVASIWFIFLAYKAFSVSCNTKGAKSIIGFIVSLLVSLAITTVVVSLMVKSLFLL